ncbi:MAG: FAD-binding oxidoreductase [Herpetosiphon sp.]
MVERHQVASGASGRNGGLLLTGIAHCYQSACTLYGRTTARALWQVTIENREAMIGLAQKLNTPVWRSGSYHLASTQRQSDDLHESALLMKQDGLDVEWYANDPLGRGFGAAIGNPKDGGIQPAFLTRALAQAAGADVLVGTEVWSIQSGDDVVVVQTQHGAVAGRRVVLATNAWTPLLVPEFQSIIMPGRGQIVATVPTRQMITRVGYCNDGFEYFQQLQDGRFVVGGFRSLAVDQEATFADHTTPLIQQAIETFLAMHFPELRDVPIERRWSGTMAFTPDGLPLVGRLRRDDRISFAVGFNGHGLGLGVMVANTLLDTLDHGSTGLFGAQRLSQAFC